MSISDEARTKVYNLINEIIYSEMFDNASYLKETLWILYEDYLKNIASTFSFPWNRDLHYWFISALEYLTTITCNDKVSLSLALKYDCIKLLISNMRQVILHVSQANRLFFEIPNTHLKHTGTYSKILRTYHGIIKCLLAVAYTIPKNSKQAELIPFITFDVTPIAESDSCPDIQVIEEPSCTKKILVIKLPYEALVNIPKFAYLLAHEIYHYVAPINRNYRNKLFGALCISVIITQIVTFYIEDHKVILAEKLESGLLKSYNKAWKNSYISVKNKIDSEVLKYVITKYDELEKILDIPGDDITWTDYINRIATKCGCQMYSNLDYKLLLYNFLGNMDFDDLFEDFIKSLSKDKKNILAVKLIDFIKIELESGIGKFENWLKSFRPSEKITLQIRDMQFALREAMADYFMIQTTKLDATGYLKFILDYKKTIAGNFQYMQIYRIGLVLEYVYGFFNNNALSKSLEARLTFIRDILTNSDFNDEEIICIVKAYEKFYISLYVYTDIFKICFESLNFDLIMNSYPEHKEEFKRTLEKTQKILCSLNYS